MKHLFTACSLAAFLAPGLAQAASVYSGCAVPTVKPGHRTFFVDPVKGSKSGDGSAAKPWRVLAEVLDRNSSLVATQGHTGNWGKGDTSLVAVNPKGVIKPGDVIMLMSGNHGSFVIQNNYNSDFISVMAAPGQTPVVGPVSIVSSSKWMFQGIKFQGQQPKGAAPRALVDVGGGDWLGPTQDIVFDNNSFSAGDDSTRWSPSDWMNLPYNYALYTPSKVSCVSATNNHFYNVMNGIAAGASNNLIQGNLIEHMANDGIDMMTSNILIKGNTIRDGANNAATSPLHADGIQGWSIQNGAETVTNKNVVVDGNTIIKTGVTTLSYLQGISIFDGLWDGLTISNNVVISNAYHGIALYGGANASIVNNTVLASNPNYGTWIYVTKSKGTVPAKNVIVRNNISTVLQISSTGVTVDHNIAEKNITALDSSGKSVQITSGSYGSSNKIVSGISSKFITLDNKDENYNLKPKSGSEALSFGTPVGAPVVDIIGNARKPSVTAGAYN